MPSSTPPCLPVISILEFVWCTTSTVQVNRQTVLPVVLVPLEPMVVRPVRLGVAAGVRAGVGVWGPTRGPSNHTNP